LNLTDTKPLFGFQRKGILEVLVHGAVWWKSKGQPAQGEDLEIPVITRSLLKPWQFLACDVAGTDAFWAVGMASHSAQPQHIEALDALARIGHASEDDLMCPRGYPLDWAAAAKLRLAGEKPRRLHHPCSGKHLLMVAACRKHGFPIENYWHEDHPIQERLFGLIGREVGEKVTWATDGCGLPTVAMPARVLLQMWEKLGTDSNPKVVELRRLWTQNPRLVGGFRRLDSDLVEAGRGKILAKEGADGLLAVQSLADGDEPSATCIVKIDSGFSVPFLALGLWSHLSTRTDLPRPFAELTDYLRSRLEEWVPDDQELVISPIPS